MAGFIEYEIQLIPRYLYYEAKEDDEYKRNELTYFFSCLLLLAAIAREMCMPIGRRPYFRVIIFAELGDAP